MLKVLFGTPVGILSIVTIVGATAVIAFWLHFIFKKHDD